MTTRTDQFPALLGPGRRIPWRPMGLSFGLTLASVLIFAVAFMVGFAFLNAGRVLPGVQVGGIALTGLDRAAAAEALADQLPRLREGHVTVSFADQVGRISYDEIDRDYDFAAMLDQAFAAGRQGSVLDQASEQLRLLLGGVNLLPQIGWNGDALSTRLGAMAEEAYIAPVDASIVRSVGAYSVVPAVDGRTIDLQLALERIAAAIDNLSAADTQVAVEATVLLPQVSTAQAQVAVDQANGVTETNLALIGGDTQVIISPEQLRGWVLLQPTGPAAWELIIERQAVADWVAGVALVTDRPAVEASFMLRDGEVVPVAGQTGLLVEEDPTTDAIYGVLLARAGGEQPTPAVSMAMTVTMPEFTTEEAVAAAPRVRMISEWTTNYTVYEGNNFGGNIEAPSNHLDGTTVAPGTTFDFWALMPATLAELPGVGPGGIILRGRTVVDGAIGGGICSVSTTMFNVAARAGLELGARRNHSYYIDRYPVGLDATVWRTSSAAQNMTFTNDTSYPVLVKTINRPGKVTFQLWSVPTGRTVDFSTPRVENEKEAKEYYEYTDELGPGETKLVEYARNGFDSWVTRTVRDASGNVIHEETFFSKYKTINGIVLVGRYSGDPRAGTMVLRSEYRPTTPKPTPAPTPDPTPTPAPTPTPTPTP